MREEVIYPGACITNARWRNKNNNFGMRGNGHINKDRKISKYTKIRLLKTLVVFSISSYEAEIWTLNLVSERKLWRPSKLNAIEKCVTHTIDSTQNKRVRFGRTTRGRKRERFIPAIRRRTLGSCYLEKLIIQDEVKGRRKQGKPE